MRTKAITLLLAALVGCGPGEETPPDVSIEVDASVRDLTVQDLAVVGSLRLSETGLYSDFSSRSLANGVLRYTPRYEAWSDGDEKERFLYLPPGAQIDTRDMDNWVFPVGTKAWKQFSQSGTLVETRLWEKTPRGWWRVAYLWNADHTEAEAAADGLANALGTTHDVPSQTDCDTCHHSMSDALIGVSAIQLSAPGGNGLLSQLAAAGRLTVRPAHEYQPPGQGGVQDALGYFHGNCGNCHNDNEFGQTNRVKLRLQLSVNDTDPEQTATYATTLWARANHLSPAGNRFVVIPGIPDSSQLYERMGYRDLWSMPPLGTKVVDPTGRATIRSWILSLPQ